MILISHRGNIKGKNPPMENHPDYIKNSLNKGFDVEIDIWSVDDKFILGHDKPQYEISENFILSNYKKLWLHCKDFNSLTTLKDEKYKNVNYFWHESDKVTITSKGYFWVYPGHQPIKNSISVLPELHNDDVRNCLGICSDFIEKYTII
jgi:hypothetical protein